MLWLYRLKRRKSRQKFVLIVNMYFDEKYQYGLYFLHRFYYSVILTGNYSFDLGTISRACT
jgi:hypothetical protein